MYSDNLKFEDDNVVTIDGSSIDSGLYSDALSPVINEDTVLELLDTRKEPIIPLELEMNVLRSASVRKRDRLGSVFRTLSLRSKRSSLPSLIKDENSTLLDTQETITDEGEDAHRFVDKSLRDATTSQISFNIETENNISNLYDNKQPLLYTSETDILNNDMLSHDDFNCLEVSEMTQTENNVLIEEASSVDIKKQKGLSTFRSLARKLSIFRRKTKIPGSVSVDNASKDTELQISNKLFEGNSSEVPERFKINTVEFFGSKFDQNEKHARQSNDDTTEIHENKTTKSDTTVSYTVKSLNLQNQLLPYHQTLPAKSCLRSNNFDLNQLNHFNGSYILQKLQTGNCLKNLPECWNVWLGNTSTINFQKKSYKILRRIVNIDSLLELCDIANFVDINLKEKYHQIFILKKGEIPIFHGKKSRKRLGEYVYVIPTGKEQLVWQSVTYLLLLGRLDLNSFGYNVRGVCWRRIDFKKNIGFHLTFYVDDRKQFSQKNMSLFLAELKVMMPEPLRQYFKKCKTLLPGEKTISIFNID